MAPAAAPVLAFLFLLRLRRLAHSLWVRRTDTAPVSNEKPKAIPTAAAQDSPADGPEESVLSSC